MRFVGLGAAGDLAVPLIICETCGTAEPSPSTVHCWPSAPLRGETWFDKGMFETFYVLRNSAGISADAFVDLINGAQQRLATAAGAPSPTPVDDSTFHGAFL